MNVVMTCWALIKKYEVHLFLSIMSFLVGGLFATGVLNYLASKESFRLQKEIEAIDKSSKMRQITWPLLENSKKKAVLN
ncbi:MAG: hypothetical protein E6Q24_14940 [Chitinophagaceae bacterium]|nr:MAG: hypothetical protein E6Q24_14940 [Chitinophagaceae bacterium]